MNQEASHLDATIADLEARRDHLTRMIEDLKLIRDGGAVPAPTSNMSSVREGEFSHDTFFQMTIPEAALKYLTITKRTRSVPEVAQALLEGGLKTTSKYFTDIVRSVMSRDDRFIRVKNGEWGLSAWYPALRRETKAKAEKAEHLATAQRARTAAARRMGEPNENPLKNRIAEFFNANPSASFTAQQVADALEAKVDSVRARLSEMAKRGAVSKTNGSYSAPQAA